MKRGGSFMFDNDKIQCRKSLWSYEIQMKMQAEKLWMLYDVLIRKFLNPEIVRNNRKIN